jgi:hypothetical protein
MELYLALKKPTETVTYVTYKSFTESIIQVQLKLYYENIKHVYQINFIT